MKNFNAVVWFEIYVDDMDRARKFYEEVFQISLTKMDSPNSQPIEMMAFPSNMEAPGSASGALVHMEGFKAGGNSTVVYFFSEDCHVEEQRVVKAGGKIFQAKTSIGDYGHMLWATDTEGNNFGIHSMK